MHTIRFIAMASDGIVGASDGSSPAVPAGRRTALPLTAVEVDARSLIADGRMTGAKPTRILNGPAYRTSAPAGRVRRGLQPRS